jgi:hypothetical protein
LFNVDVLSLELMFSSFRLGREQQQQQQQQWKKSDHQQEGTVAMIPGGQQSGRR